MEKYKATPANHSRITSWGQIEDLEKRLSDDSDNPEILLQLGRVFHNQAAENGSRDVLRKAEKYLDRFRPSSAPEKS